jgi:hypothetical protein
LDVLSKLKPRLVENYEHWRTTHEVNSGSSAPGSDPLTRRKREEELQAQELEHTRQALEASRIEDEERRYELARRNVEDQHRRVQEERERARLSRESDDERRRVEDRRRQEQEGIIRRQQESEAAAKEARRHISSISTSSSQPRVDTTAYYRRSQEPEAPARPGASIPVATPQPSRPPSSSRTYNDHYSSLAASLPQIDQPYYSHDIVPNGRADLGRHGERSMPVEPSPSKSRAPIGYVNLSGCRLIISSLFHCQFTGFTFAVTFITLHLLLLLLLRLQI